MAGEACCTWTQPSRSSTTTYWGSGSSKMSSGGGPGRVGLFLAGAIRLVLRICPRSAGSPFGPALAPLGTFDRPKTSALCV